MRSRIISCPCQLCNNISHFVSNGIAYITGQTWIVYHTYHWTVHTMALYKHYMVRASTIYLWISSTWTMLRHVSTIKSVQRSALISYTLIGWLCTKWSPIAHKTLLHKLCKPSYCFNAVPLDGAQRLEALPMCGLFICFDELFSAVHNWCHDDTFDVT